MRPPTSGLSPELEETPGASRAEQALVGAKRSERVNAVDTPLGETWASLGLTETRTAFCAPPDWSRPHCRTPFAQSEAPERKKNKRACPPPPSKGQEPRVAGQNNEGNLEKQKPLSL